MYSFNIRGGMKLEVVATKYFIYIYIERHVVYGTGPGLGWPAGLCYLLGCFWISVSAMCYSSLSLFFITVETKIYIYFFFKKKKVALGFNRKDIFFFFAFLLFE